MTAMPYPPSKDFRAPYAGDAPYIRDTMNPYRTSPDFPQNLLRVTRRGADDSPTPEEHAIMSNGFSGLGAVSPMVHARLRGVLAGLGKGGGGGHGDGGHGGGGHHGRGRGRGRGGPGWWGGGPWYGGGDTYIVDTPQCPYGYVWDAAHLRCIMATGMSGLGRLGPGRRGPQSHVSSMRAPTGGGSRPGYPGMKRDLDSYRDGTMPSLGALRAGAYMGAVGRHMDAPSVTGAALRGQVQRVVLSGAGVGDLCSDQGVAMGAGIASQALDIIGGALKTTAGSSTDQSHAGGIFTDAGGALAKTYANVCAGQQQNAGQQPPSTTQAQNQLAQLQNAGLLTPPAGSAPPAAAPSAGVSTKTLMIGGAAAAGLLGLAWFLFK